MLLIDSTVYQERRGMKDPEVEKYRDRGGKLSNLYILGGFIEEIENNLRSKCRGITPSGTICLTGSVTITI